MEAFVIIIIGITLIYGGVKLRLKIKKLSAEGEIAEGIVYDIIESDNIDSRAYYPVIRFLTREQEWITEEYGISATSNRFKKGQKVHVFYHPDNPKIFLIKSKSSATASILTTAMGIILMIVGAYKLYIEL
jgi:hypothetical protein